MRKNVLFFGNCQANAIYVTMNLSPLIYNVFSVPCWTIDKSKNEFTEIIKNCDIIVTQSINDNYRDLDYLSTNYIKNNKKTDCKLVILDSLHFDFYYFDLTYKTFNNDVLHVPIDYHYNYMIDCYIKRYTEEYYINNFVNNLNLKSNEELDTIAENSLNELQRRYSVSKEKYNSENDINIYVKSYYKFIKENYKNKLLFYSMNHPTKCLTQFICEDLVSTLQIENTINYSVDELESTRCILYKCISKNVNFDISKHDFLTLNTRDVSEITQLYYDTYKKIGFI